MGMGRDLFRRKALILLLCTILFGIFLLLAVSPISRADPGAADPGFLLVRADQRRGGSGPAGGASAPAGSTGRGDGASAPAGSTGRGDGAAEPAAVEQPAAPEPAAPEPAAPEPAAVEPAAALHDRGCAALLELGFPDHPAVKQWRERFLAGGTRALQETLDRGRTFRRFIAARLAERGLPQELIYLPILESHYRVWAVSRSGATGLWQIAANTAAPLGLVTDRWVDERRDFWRSTEGALRKLEENYATFGDWDLALAAYNCGTGKLSRTIRASGVRDFWALRDLGVLPPETAAYVPKFYALVSIFSDPTAHGLEVSWQQAPTWRRLPLGRSVELALLAEKAGLPLSLMEEAHAELETPITPPVSGRTYHLKIPAEYGERVAALLADPQVQLLRYTFHRIRSGDTFYALAEYYELSVALLMEANPAVPPRSLRIGEQLRIPVFSGRPVKTEPIVSLSEDEAAAFSALHTVAAGDTLWGISRRYGTTAEILAWVNGRSLDALLKPGETLKVPPPAHGPAPAPTTPQPLAEEGEPR
jgi:membrane-bound lytic murein transglycosylase D